LKPPPEDGRERDPEVLFLRRPGSVFLDAPAAARACTLATDRHFAIIRVEGGIWRVRSFEARLDAIWDGDVPPLSAKALEINNDRAAEMILEDNEGCDTFVLTVKENPSE